MPYTVAERTDGTVVNVAYPIRFNCKMVVEMPGYNMSLRFADAPFGLESGDKLAVSIKT